MTSQQQLDSDPSLEDLLNQFFVKNKLGLDEIQEHINRFNPIKVMGMEHMEIRHSFILRWLLDPKENHGLEDQFLKKFIEVAFRKHKENGLSPHTRY